MNISYAECITGAIYAPVAGDINETAYISNLDTCLESYLAYWRPSYIEIKSRDVNASNKHNSVTIADVSELSKITPG